MIIEIITSTVLLLVAISVLVVVHVCVVGRAFRSDPGNGMTPAPTRAVKVKNMKAEDIKELPCFEYKVEEGQEKEIGSECSVCLEIFKTGEKCRMLPKCNHSFHAECIDSWLSETGACPICRTAATKSPMLQEISVHSGEALEDVIQ